MKNRKANFAASQLYDSQVRDLISQALAKKVDRYCYVGQVNRLAGTFTFTYWGDSTDTTYEASFTIGEDYTVTVSDATPIIQVVTNEPIDGAALFSIERGDDGGIRAMFAVGDTGGRIEKTIDDKAFAVYPNTLLFKAGDYPDKQFSMSPEEIANAAAGWKSIGGNIQHTDFLRGSAAFIDDVWTEDDNNVLRGEVRIPLALDELLTKNEKKISLEWKRADKLADGFALCTNPRIEDAVLMSLDTTTGKQNVPPTPKKESKPMNKAQELIASFSSFIQDITGKSAEATAPVEDKKDAVSDAALREALDAADAARKAQFTAEAEAFWTLELQAGRVMPPEKANFTKQFIQAALDDLKLKDTVTFSVGDKEETGTRVAQFKAAQTNRLPHILTTEQINDATKVVFTQPTTDAPGERVPDPTSVYASRAKTMGQPGQ